MLWRRFLPVAPAALVVGSLTVWLSRPVASGQELFLIARSKNANVVRYDVRLDKGGRYDVRRPLDVYWLMHAEDGRREELTELERRAAYGYELMPGAKATEFRVQLIAVKQRPVTVRSRGGTFRAEVEVGGERAELEKIFVATKESGLVPKVLYVELSGKSVASGKAVRERIARD